MIIYNKETRLFRLYFHLIFSVSYLRHCIGKRTSSPETPSTELLRRRIFNFWICLFQCEAPNPSQCFLQRLLLRSSCCMAARTTKQREQGYLRKGAMSFECWPILINNLCLKNYGQLCRHKLRYCTTYSLTRSDSH